MEKRDALLIAVFFDRCLNRRDLFGRQINTVRVTLRAGAGSSLESGRNFPALVLNLQSQNLKLKQLS